MKPYLLLVLGVVVALALWILVPRAGSVGHLEQKIDSLQAANDTLRQVRIPKVDTLYREVRDTLRMTRTRTDSILKTDTLIRVERVQQLISDERRSCDAVVSTCEVRVAQRDTALAQADTIRWAKDSVIDLLKKPCSYLGVGGPCPEISAFGGVNTRGLVAGVGISIPIKKIRVRF